MDFDAVYTHLFNGYAILVDDSELVYMAEEGDGSFYIDSNEGDNYRRFCAENNPGEIEQDGLAFTLVDDDGRTTSIKRLSLG